MESYRIKEKYSRVFKVVETYLGVDMISVMIALVAETEAEQAGLCRNDFNDIRKVVERVFEVLHEYQLLPHDIYTGSGSITMCSRYLCNDDSLPIVSKHKIAPPTIAYVLRGLLTLVQDGSHGAGNLSLGVDAYVKMTDSAYVYRSCVYQLLEVLIWLGRYLASSPNKQDWTQKEETSLVRSGGWIEGRVMSVAHNGFGTFLPNAGNNTISIHPTMVTKYGLVEDDRISVTTAPSPNGKKIHIRKIRKL